MMQLVNRRHFITTIAGAAVGGSLLSRRHAIAADDLVVVRPKEIDDVLVNPDMGYETFYCFNHNRQFRSQGKMVEATNYPLCSVAYFRFFWSQLEKKEGEYDFDLIESRLAAARRNGQHLAFSIMAYFAGVPPWFQQKAKRGFAHYFRMDRQRQLWSPDYNDPDFLDRQERLAAALAGRFNGHPDLAHIDIGHIGNSGEWHTDTCPRVDGQGRVPMANTETARRVIDWYAKYWNKTPKVMPYHHVTPPEFVEYAVRQGAGWRYNGWGAKIGRYAEKLRLAHAEDAWKRGPVALEPVGADGWAKEDHATAFKAALALHVSCAHGYMVPIPDEKVPLLNDFLRRCGYRFVLRELRAPRRVVRGGNLPVQMAFENIGVAPPYRAYVLAVRLTSGGKSFVLNTDAKLTSWLPGKHGLEARLSLPVDIPAGNYELAVGILAPHNRTPAVKLAIEGRGDDGWYPLSHVEVRT